MSTPSIRTRVPELDELERLIHRHESRVRVDIACNVRYARQRLPVYVVELGSTSPEHPAIGFFAGVHGNERIGSKVVLSYMHTLLEQLRWDDLLVDLLKRVRIVFMPVVNPGGMWRRSRATPRGVDLMRNAPVEAEHPHWLLGGQRLSRYLPWYRGRADRMEPEARALCTVVTERLLPHAFALSLDSHSGFGARDRIWFPYARTREPIPHLADLFALRSLFRATYPFHVHYRIEPQAQHYMTHGDLWDHLYDQALEQPDRAFLPLTLEMGSWLWVRKSPMQIFRREGLFNPFAPHRRRRILRQHLAWFDFLVRATAAYSNWLPNLKQRVDLTRLGREHWHEHFEPTANESTPGIIAD